MINSQENASAYSEAEAKRLGYDWKVVSFFRGFAPNLLKIMWGKNSDLYNKILKNTISDEELSYYDGDQRFGSASMSSEASKAMLSFRRSQSGQRR